MTSTETHLRFQITGMDCANCARSIETGVGKLPDVRDASINFTTGTLRVAGAISAERVVARVRELGYDVAPDAGEQGVTGAGANNGDTPAPLLPRSPSFV